MNGLERFGFGIAGLTVTFITNPFVPLALPLKKQKALLVELQTAASNCYFAIMALIISPAFSA